MDQELIDDLYSTMVLEHSRNPRNFGILNCSCHAKGKNSSCGDELVIFLDKDKNSINEIKFSGQGCALSMASSSLMTQAVKGQSIEYSKSLIHDFIEFIIHSKLLSDDYEPLHIFSGVRRFPLRVKCVLLGWRTLEALLTENTTSTISPE